MGEKDELRRLFIENGETTISGIPEFPGDLITYEKKFTSISVLGKQRQWF